jgi:hypothetical protein
LAGYDARYRPTSGPGAVTLNVNLEYQEVKGLQLPRRNNDGAPTQMELVFGDYRVKTR